MSGQQQQRDTGRRHDKLRARKRGMERANMDQCLSGGEVLRGSAGRSIQARLRGVAEVRRNAGQARQMRNAGVLREGWRREERLRFRRMWSHPRTTRSNSLRRRNKAEPQAFRPTSYDANISRGCSRNRAAKVSNISMLKSFHVPLSRAETLG